MNNTACRNSTIARLFRTIKRYDAKKQNPDDGAIVSRLRRIVRLRLPMEFLSFTCSTTNPEYLFSKTPWLYVNTDIRGNNLEADLPKLERVYRDLGKSYANIKFIVLVGNTDPYYIYSRQFDLYQGQNKACCGRSSTIGGPATAVTSRNGYELTSPSAMLQSSAGMSSRGRGNGEIKYVSKTCSRACGGDRASISRGSTCNGSWKVSRRNLDQGNIFNSLRCRANHY